MLESYACEWTRHTRFTRTAKATRTALYPSVGVHLPAQLGKQKLHTKGSTEVELVGVSNYFPHTIWVKMFLEAQG